MQPSNTIIAKFIAKHIKDLFYSAYLIKIANNNPIKTEMINLSQGGKLMISESLTLYNSKLFSVCMQLKKEKKLVQVFTQDGQVCIKAIKSSKATVVRTQREVDTFIALTEKSNANQKSFTTSSADVTNSTNPSIVQNTVPTINENQNAQPGFKQIASPLQNDKRQE